MRSSGKSKHTSSTSSTCCRARSPRAWTSSRAAAAFGAAKLFEGPQRYGVAQDLEEWAHEQGAHIVAMSQLVAENGEQVGRMLRKLGYEPSEMTYVKGG